MSKRRNEQLRRAWWVFDAMLSEHPAVLSPHKCEIRYRKKWGRDWTRHERALIVRALRPFGVGIAYQSACGDVPGGYYSDPTGLASQHQQKEQMNGRRGSAVQKVIDLKNGIDGTDRALRFHEQVAQGALAEIITATSPNGGPMLPEVDRIAVAARFSRLQHNHATQSLTDAFRVLNPSAEQKAEVRAEQKRLAVPKKRWQDDWPIETPRPTKKAS